MRQPTLPLWGLLGLHMQQVMQWGQLRWIRQQEPQMALWSMQQQRQVPWSMQQAVQVLVQRASQHQGQWSHMPSILLRPGATLLCS